MLENNQYINILLSVFFITMIAFMLLARQMVVKIELKQQEIINVL